MNATLSAMWPKVLNLLKNELTEISYNTWIKTIKPIYIDSTTLELEVPTDFNKGILESRYIMLISNAIKQVTLREYSIVVTTQQESARKQSEGNDNDDVYNSILNPKYTFDTFVIGNSNRLAHAASVAVAEAPAQAYNPLFLYGGVGLGKTHLMHAIGHYILSQNATSRVLYVSSEKFTNELINAIKDDRNEEFRGKYRNIDVLLIDDIQFIGGKERTQEEFFHTFNALYEAHKQIVISSDRSPRDIPTLEDRLRSRFEWGLTADIQFPDLETRIAILKKKAQMENVIIPDDVFVFIADKVVSNIRELEGALNKVIAYSSLTDAPISVDLCTEVLKELLSSQNARVIDIPYIIESVARYFDLQPEDFFSKKRNRSISYPRQIAMYLSREITGTSLPKIGEEFGGRDHTTVIHAIQKIEEDIQNNTETRRAVEELRRNISGQ
ncbi:MAG: chromosomal replication initiator protein DnaA [Acetivibrionales bacterium]